MKIVFVKIMENILMNLKKFALIVTQDAYNVLIKIFAWNVTISMYLYNLNNNI
jgi:hypothetical protein